MAQDRFYMKSALRLAARGTNRVSPNPRVGCIIVRNNLVVGRGYHEYFGGPHAEVNALSKAGRLSRGADLYVTLEPCCHYGKTPPCTDAIIGAGIKRVVIAMKDTNPLMKGRSIGLLKRNGIDVITGVLEKEAGKLNESYIKYIKNRRPFVILKAALTLDGKIASPSGDSRWITGIASRKYVHKLRSQVDAILVGINTVLVDNPRLTARRKGMNPVRIVLDTRLRIPVSARVLDNEAPALVVTCSDKKKKVKQLKEKGVNVIILKERKGGIDLKKLMKVLGESSISSVLVEGGGSINASFLNRKLVDKVLFFIAPKILGGRDSITPVEGPGLRNVKKAIVLKDINTKRIGSDILVEGYL